MNLKAALALGICLVLLISSVPPSKSAEAQTVQENQNDFSVVINEHDNLTSSQNQDVESAENLPENARILYQGIIGSFAAEKLVEPIIDFQGALGKLENDLLLLENASEGAEENEIQESFYLSLEEFGTSIQELDNVAQSVYLELDENLENYRKLVEGNKIQREDVDEYEESIEGLKLRIENLITKGLELYQDLDSIDQAENFDAIFAKLAEVKSLLEKITSSRTVTLESYGFYTILWIPFPVLVPVDQGYRGVTYYFWFKLKNDGWLSAGWDGNFNITVDYGERSSKSWGGQIPGWGGTYSDTASFVPEMVGGLPWDFAVNWNDGWSSGTIKNQDRLK